MKTAQEIFEQLNSIDENVRIDEMCRGEALHNSRAAENLNTQP